MGLTGGSADTFIATPKNGSLIRSQSVALDVPLTTCYRIHRITLLWKAMPQCSNTYRA